MQVLLIGAALCFSSIPLNGGTRWAVKVLTSIASTLDTAWQPKGDHASQPFTGETE